MRIGKKRDLRISFSYPYGNGFEPHWVESLIALLLHEIPKDPDARILGSILKFGSCYVDMNRDTIIQQFLAPAVTDDWLLMIDPDIQFFPDILERLALYITKNPKAKIIAGRVNLGNGFPVFYNHSPIDGRPMHQPFAFVGLKPFDLVGAGILCVHREVFAKIIKETGHGGIFAKIISSEMLRIGDDFSFCLRAKRVGYKLYGAWDIFGQHWKIMPCPQNYPDIPQLV